MSISLKSLSQTLLLLMVTTSSYAAQVKDYSELLQTVKQGYPITIVTHFEKCQDEASKIPNKTLSYFRPHAIWVVADGQEITTSDLHFTDYMGKPVYQYLQYTFTPNNRVIIVAKSLKPGSFLAKAKAITMSCPLGSAIAVFYPKTTHD